jgi:hypothetical protein
MKRVLAALFAGTMVVTAVGLTGNEGVNSVSVIVEGHLQGENEGTMTPGQTFSREPA